MRTGALIFAIFAGIAVASLMVWTAVGWARSDRARATCHAAEHHDEDEPSGG
jgi:hypothetical protein